MRKIFITGIGTDVGKTLIASILTEALQADYWKPVQAGDAAPTDSQLVKSLISNSKSIVHPETYLLKHAMSPHAAARMEGINIDPKKIQLPATNNSTLVIEGAGGLMVPLNDTYFVADLITQLDTEVVLVIQNYLGSINHSLLTIQELKRRKCKITGIIFNGETNKESEKIILDFSGLPLLGCITVQSKIDPVSVLENSKRLSKI